MLPNRMEYEMPLALADWGWQYHHIGIPTNEEKPDEHYIPHLKMYVSGFDTSPFGVEWMRFEADSPVDPLVQSIPHVAFAVEDLDEALAVEDFNILTLPHSPSESVRVAMIEYDGAPVELIEFTF